MIRKIRDALLLALTDPDDRWTIEAGDRGSGTRHLGDLTKGLAVLALVSSEPVAESLGCSALATVWQITAIGANPDQAHFVADELQAITRTPGWLPYPWVMRAEWQGTGAGETEATKSAALILELAIAAEVT